MSFTCKQMLGFRYRPHIPSPGLPVIVIVRSLGVAFLFRRHTGPALCSTEMFAVPLALIQDII